MTLRHMKIFVTVCECNSMTLAAKKLYLAQPAVSLAMSEIESYYGIKLFDRISRRIHITESGKQLLSYAKRITAEFDAMENEIKNWDSISALKIGSSVTIGTYLMPDFVKQFSEHYPQIKVNVTVNNSDSIEQQILENELDFALIEGITHSPNIISKPFLEDKLVLICALDHSIAEKNAVTLEEIKSQQFLLREKGSGTREIVDSIMASHGIKITPTWESASTLAIIHAVMNGLGISVLPYLLVKREVSDGKIKVVPIEQVEFNRQFHIIYHKDKYLTKSAQNFIEMCKNNKEPSSFI